MGSNPCKNREKIQTPCRSCPWLVVGLRMPVLQSSSEPPYCYFGRNIALYISHIQDFKVKTLFISHVLNHINYGTSILLTTVICIGRVLLQNTHGWNRVCEIRHSKTWTFNLVKNTTSQKNRSLLERDITYVFMWNKTDCKLYSRVTNNG